MPCRCRWQLPTAKIDESHSGAIRDHRFYPRPRRRRFADARQVQSQAIERLEAGDIRDAAEKAWCATKRATDALILANTGEEPPTTAATTDLLDDLCRVTPQAQALQGRYYSRIYHLHGMCFYSGYCNSQTERRIRETVAYIDDAENLAAG